MRYSCVAAALAAIGTLGAASNALAADCNFAGQNVVYVTGSSASSPYLQNLSPLLAAQSKPVTLVYIQTESCQGVTDFTTSTALTSSATYWTASTTDGGAPASNTCNFSATSSPAVSTLADVGVSDVYSATCGVTLTSSQQEYEGPTQAMTFIVNPSSTETSISEEAAHVVFKDIGLTSPTYQVSPWTDPGQLFIRQGGAAGSGTRAMIRGRARLRRQRLELRDSRGEHLHQQRQPPGRGRRRHRERQRQPRHPVGDQGRWRSTRVERDAAGQGPRLSGEGPDVRLSPRLDGIFVRQAERARRALRHLGSAPLRDGRVQRQAGQHVQPGCHGRRCRAGPGRPRLARRFADRCGEDERHRGRRQGSRGRRVRDARPAHVRGRPGGVLRADRFVRLLLGIGRHGYQAR